MVGKVTVTGPSKPKPRWSTSSARSSGSTRPTPASPRPPRARPSAPAGWPNSCEEVGYQTEYIEAGAPGRGNVFARLEGADPERGALMLHGHLDVVPAEASDWSVHPFSGAVEDGYVWGRGAVDMKDMVGMMIAVARHFKRSGIVPPRDLVFALRLRRGGRRQVRLQVAGRQPARPVRGRHRGDRRGRRVLADDPAPRRRRAHALPDRDRREGDDVDAADRARTRGPRVDDPRQQRRHRGRRSGRPSWAAISSRWS